MTDLGPWSISHECYEKIVELLPSGTILELGSGPGTALLSERYKVYSVEDNPKFVNKYGSTYIHAPNIDGWYDVGVLKRELPESYDLILIDGPLATINPFARMGFYSNIGLFNTKVPMVFDDVNRKWEMALARLVASFIGRDIQIFGQKKQFAVV